MNLSDFERFSDAARTIFQLSGAIAFTPEMRHSVIDAGHILLAVHKHRNNPGARLLLKHDFNSEIASEIVKVNFPRYEVEPSIQPLTVYAKNAVERAVALAGSGQVLAPMLLVGALESGSPVVERMLSRNGLDVATLVAALDV